MGNAPRAAASGRFASSMKARVVHPSVLGAGRRSAPGAVQRAAAGRAIPIYAFLTRAQALRNEELLRLVCFALLAAIKEG